MKRLVVGDYWKAIELAAEQGYRANLRTGEVFGRSGKRLKARRYAGQDYPTMRLHVRGLPKRAYSVPVHKFVAFLIWGRAALAPGVHVRHRNGDTEKNTKSNLRLGTPSENAMDKPKSVRIATAKAARAAQGVTPCNAKLGVGAVRLILDELSCNTISTGRVRRGVVKNLAERFGVSRSAISLIGKGVSYRSFLEKDEDDDQS